MALTESWLKAQHRKGWAKEFVKADQDGLSTRVYPKGNIPLPCDITMVKFAKP